MFKYALLDENNMKRYMTGVVEQVDLEKNFELISKLTKEIEEKNIKEGQEREKYMKIYSHR